MTATKDLLRQVEQAVEKGSLSVHVQVYLERQQAVLRRLVAFGMPVRDADAIVLRQHMEHHR